MVNCHVNRKWSDVTRIAFACSILRWWEMKNIKHEEIVQGLKKLKWHKFKQQSLLVKALIAVTSPCRRPPWHMFTQASDGTKVQDSRIR